MEVLRMLNQLWSEEDHEECGFCDMLLFDLEGMFLEESKMMEE